MRQQCQENKQQEEKVRVDSRWDRDRDREKEYQGVSPEEKPWGGDTVNKTRKYGQTWVR